MSGQESELVVVHNRRARHDYHLEDSWEAGIVLVAPGQGAARLPRVRPPRTLARICFSGLSRKTARAT